MSFDLFMSDTPRFLATHVLLSPASLTPSGTSVHRQSGVFRVRFRKGGAPATRLADNAPCDVYSLERPDAWNTALPEFKAYFCFYEPDEFHMLVVDRYADLMFTPRMDGCSFGVGSATDTGARLVGHVNVSRTENTAEGQRQQTRTQKEMLREAMPGASIMSPKQYMPFGSGQAGTTVGVRDPGSGQWSFYTQVWKRVSSSYQLCDPAVIRFA
jgi:hypothetical protein